MEIPDNYNFFKQELTQELLFFCSQWHCKTKLCEKTKLGLSRINLIMIIESFNKRMLKIWDIMAKAAKYGGFIIRSFSNILTEFF